MLNKAIEKRCSRRSYEKTPLSSSHVEQLQELIAQYNQLGGIHMQLLTNRGEAFSKLKKSYGMFSNVQNYVALVGNTKDVYTKEKLGYYGEALVLEATRLGLGTCWVGGTYDKDTCVYDKQNNEELYCLIAIGNVNDNLSLKEKLIGRAIHRKSKSIEEMSEVTGNRPTWFVKGMEAVQQAPSAIFKQPVKFYLKNNIVSAKVENEDGANLIDLGIAMKHFELGAGNIKFSWGNPATCKV